MSQQAEAAGVAAQVRAGKGGLGSEHQRMVWLLLTPTLLVVAVVALWPLLQTIYLSFTDAELAGIDPTEFVGLENCTYLLTDPAWWNSVSNTLYFTVATVVMEFILGMIIALVINSNFRGRGLMRAAMLIPWAIPTVISAQMWKWMYNDIYGVCNDIFTRVGLIDRDVAFLANPRLAIPAIAAVDIWKTTPFVALLLLAGLQVIPGDVYEASTVDGATRWQQFRSITLPLLRPAIAVTLIFRTLDALRVFDVFYVMFGNRADTQTMAIYAQQNIVAFSDLGYGSAISIAIFIVIGIFVTAYVTFIGVEER